MENFSCRVKSLLQRSFFGGFFVAALASVPGFALAASSASSYANNTTGGNLTVSLNVASACVVGTSNPTLDITGWTPSQYAVSNNSVGSVAFTVACSTGIPYSIGLGSGEDAGTSRVLTSTSTPSATIPYTLLQPGSSTAWGNTSASWLTQTADGKQDSTTITASIPALDAMPAPGTYTDTVLITVNY